MSKVDRQHGGSLHSFTLVEMMVAIAVLALLLILVLPMATNSLTVFRRIHNVLRSNSDASITLDIITKDLQNMAISRQPFETLQSQPLASFQNAQGHWLTFLALTDDGVTNPEQTSGISYQLAYQDPITANGTHPVYGLYRTIVPPATTFASLQGQTNQVQAYWSANTGSVTAPSNLLAENVVYFGIIFSYIDQNGAREFIPETDNVSLRGDGIYVNGTIVPSASDVQAEVILTLLSDSGSTQLRANPSLFSQILLKESSNYSRVIQLNTALP